MKGGRDILSEYGHDVPHPQAPRATSGGVTRAEPLRYSPPVGPKGQHDQGPGLHANNYGNARCPVARGGESGGHLPSGSKGGSQRG